MRTFFLIVAMACALFADPCPKCREEVAKDWKFCPKCGAALPDPGPAALEEDFSGGADAATGGRFPGRMAPLKGQLVARNGGSMGPEGTEPAVVDGLKWLARHQAADGSWSSAGFKGECKGDPCPGPGYVDYDAGCTGLALLAFLGAGYSHLTVESYVDSCNGKTVCWGDTVKSGLKWLMAAQDKEGCFGNRKSYKYMYNHSISALAMAEAYGLTGSTLLKNPAQKGIDFILQAQNPYKAWRYTKQCGDNDTSVSMWCLMALKSGDTAGLTVGKTGFQGANAWIKEVTGEVEFKVGYTAKGSGQVIVQGKNNDWAMHETFAAAGMLIRIFTDRNKLDPALAGGAKLLAADLPKFADKKIDFYYWYHSTLALFQYDGPDGKIWKSWNEAMRVALLPSQRTAKHGCAEGSWESEGDRWGFEGGRLYATALNTLTLETYYRYPVELAKKK